MSQDEKDEESERSLDSPEDGQEPALDLQTAQLILETGDIEIVARMPYSSNGTYLVHVTTDDLDTAAIYKPVNGERPLWDFPPGLHRREIAAFELSDHLGWGVIPPTVERDGPHGLGSMQLFIEANFEQHHFTLVKNQQHHDDLKALCVFDLIANNTDRKSGHCLLAPWGSIYGIDHGLCFAEEFKLRTVIWDFAYTPIPEHLVEGASRIAVEIPERLSRWLEPEEAEAVQRRAQWIAENPEFPEDETGRRWPWPLV
jgi:uncharacterized repeat protein (TIGR03843 family)